MNADNSDNFDDYEEEQSFAELFESFGGGMDETIQVGDKIKGRIISIGTDWVYVAVGAKIDGVIGRGDLQDENGEMPYKNGDEVDLFVIEVNESEIVLAKAISKTADHRFIYHALDHKIPVEGRITAPCKGGFLVEVMKKRAFCPLSRIDIKSVKNPDDYVGKTFQFLITKIENRGKNIVVSRRDLLEEALKKDRDRFYGDLAVGRLLEGRVTKLMPYGAFVELFPGIEGMVHISELSWSRIERTADVLQEDEMIQVKVVAVEKGENGKPLKIALSIKQIEGDPWEKVDQLFKADDKVPGRITRLVDFGAFVEIAPGIEGLVHISEISYVKRIIKPGDVLSKGDTVSVMIKEIDKGKKRISLSIRDAEGDPWVNITSRYDVGAAITGRVEKKERFGYFITLEPGITGLLPISEIRKSYDGAAIERLKPGDDVSIVVKQINPKERKISLAPADSSADSRWEPADQTDQTSMGTLAEKLQQALKEKEDNR